MRLAAHQRHSSPNTQLQPPLSLPVPADPRLPPADAARVAAHPPRAQPEPAFLSLSSSPSPPSTGRTAQESKNPDRLSNPQLLKYSGRTNLAGARPGRELLQYAARQIRPHSPLLTESAPFVLASARPERGLSGGRPGFSNLAGSGASLATLRAPLSEVAYAYELARMLAAGSKLLEACGDFARECDAYLCGERPAADTPPRGRSGSRSNSHSDLLVLHPSLL